MTIELNAEEEVVMILLAQGFTGKEISEFIIDLTESRIREIKKNFTAKFGARNPSHAIYLALRQELL